MGANPKTGDQVRKRNVNPVPPSKHVSNEKAREDILTSRLHPNVHGQTTHTNSRTTSKPVLKGSHESYERAMKILYGDPSLSRMKKLEKTY